MMISYLVIGFSRQAVVNYNIPNLFHLVRFAATGKHWRVGQALASGRRKRKRDFSLREPTASQERSGKKKSARSVRNDGWARAVMSELKLRPPKCSLTSRRRHKGSGRSAERFLRPEGLSYRRPALGAWYRSNFFEQVPRKCFPQCLRPIVGPLFGLNSWNGTSALDEEPEDELKLPKGGGVTKEEERFLSA